MENIQDHLLAVGYIVGNCCMKYYCLIERKILRSFLKRSILIRANASKFLYLSSVALADVAQKGLQELDDVLVKLHPIRTILLSLIAEFP
jgi:hypothetical protein